MKIVPALLLSIPLLGVLLFVIFQTDWEFAQNPSIDEGTLTLGSLLLDKYLLPFELASILLLGALIGALMLARPEES